MGRLLNIIPKTLFGGKKMETAFDETSTKPLKDLGLNIKETIYEQQKVPTTEEKQNLLSTDGGDTVTKKKRDYQSCSNGDDIKDTVPKKENVFEKYNVDNNTTADIEEINLREQIQSLKRSFLFEQNTLVEKSELEKFELREGYEEEKTRLKRAFENEKTELLKEIERKDKMLHELARVLKEEYQKDLETYKKDLKEGIESKSRVFTELETKMNSMIQNLNKIVKNNEFNFANLEEFKTLKSAQAEYLILSENLETSTVDENSPTFDKLLSITRSAITRSVSDPERKKESKISTNVYSKTKTQSFEEDDIQHEMAEVYRKQKKDLVKLFNAEKEEERKRLDKDKYTFEKEIRTEYESRMSVERKAWQDTIEDLEREINILKYEREQMDRNYCVGMDEMRTEFEVEKQTIYRRYSDQQLIFQNKLKEMHKAGIMTIVD